MRTLQTAGAKVTKKLTRRIPTSVRKQLEKLSRTRFAKKLLFFGCSRYCTICKSPLRFFQPYGLAQRPDARCPVCGALERHRSLWLFLKLKTDLFKATPQKMLYVAPVKALLSRFNDIPHLDCLTADLNNPEAMERMDITDIHHPDNSFDIIYCSHVFEHVPDDRKAMRELSRVLKPDGWAVLTVPITADKTFEDLSITEPNERERVFGQHDHVRNYGPDFKMRLEQSGFDVQRYCPADFLKPAQITRNATKDGALFFCKKKHPDPTA